MHATVTVMGVIYKASQAVKSYPHGTDGFTLAPKKSRATDFDRPYKSIILGWV
jgi:hypothetical protein